MAHIATSRSSMNDLGNLHHHNHPLMHEDASLPRIHNPRSTSTDSAPSSTHHNEGRGDEQSTSEEAVNDDDEEDSNTVQDNDEEQDDDDDAEVAAPSHGQGKGKTIGKRPALYIDAVDDDDDLAQEETDTLATLRKGLSHIPISRQNLSTSKKRTFSNLSSTSVLFGDDSTDQESFPRRTTAKKLRSGAAKPLLMYSESTGEAQENAIQSDDDEDYSGVNLVSDDDATDVDIMEQEEEDFILHDELQATVLLNEYRDARRLSLESFASEDVLGPALPVNNDYTQGLPDLGFAQFFSPEAVSHSPDPTVKRKFSDGSAKRVRFDDEVQASESSSSESSDLDSTVFPDLFLEQDKLPPVLHQLLEIENDEDNGDFASPQSDTSFWDFGHDEQRIASVNNSQDSDDGSSAGSSGYDSDMGDTTDEEDFGSDVPPRTPLQPRASVLRRPESAPGSRASTPKPFQRSMRPTGRQVPPARGIFIHDDTTKAIAVTNRATKTVTFYRPRPVPWTARHGVHSSTSSTANGSPRNSIAQMNASDSELNNEVFSNALGTDIMLSGIFGYAPGNDFAFGNQSIGPPEAFYPFVSIGTNGNMNIVEDDTFDDSDDYEDDLNITDFMDFGSDADDTDVEAYDDISNDPTTPGASQFDGVDSTPAQSTPNLQTPVRKRTASDAMLEHFDRGVVTAFRNNQDRFRDIASLPQAPSDRASLSQPVRSGKSAEALITPMRKRSKPNRVGRSSIQSSSPFKHPGSPLNGVTRATNRLQRSVLGSSGGSPRRMKTFS